MVIEPWSQKSLLNNLFQFQELQDQLLQLLPEFPNLCKLPGIASYTNECCRLSWSMVNQIPPMGLEHSATKFTSSMHTRFHSSSDKHNKVKMYVWPTLMDSSDRTVLNKGVVWTWRIVNRVPRLYLLRELRTEWIFLDIPE